MTGCVTADKVEGIIPPLFVTPTTPKAIDTIAPVAPVAAQVPVASPVPLVSAARPVGSVITGVSVFVPPGQSPVSVPVDQTNTANTSPSTTGSGPTTTTSSSSSTGSNLGTGRLPVDRSGITACTTLPDGSTLGNCGSSVGRLNGGSQATGTTQVAAAKDAESDESGAYAISSTTLAVVSLLTAVVGLMV